MNDVINAISTVGFPIVCTMMLGYLLLQEKDVHKEEMLELRKSIEGNTLVMNELKFVINEIRKDKVEENESN